MSNWFTGYGYLDTDGLHDRIKGELRAEGLALAAVEAIEKLPPYDPAPAERAALIASALPGFHSWGKRKQDRVTTSIHWSRPC